MQLFLRSYYFVTVLRYIYGRSVGDQLDHYVRNASHANSYISLSASWVTTSSVFTQPRCRGMPLILEI
jgi:hypothetical protein